MSTNDQTTIVNGVDKKGQPLHNILTQPQGRSFLMCLLFLGFLTKKLVRFLKTITCLLVQSRTPAVENVHEYDYDAYDL